MPSAPSVADPPRPSSPRHPTTHDVPPAPVRKQSVDDRSPSGPADVTTNPPNGDETGGRSGRGGHGAGAGGDHAGEHHRDAEGEGQPDQVGGDADERRAGE